MRRKCAETSYGKPLPGAFVGHRTQGQVDTLQEIFEKIEKEKRSNLNDIAPTTNSEPTQAKSNN